jgi:hypothetical protein
MEQITLEQMLEELKQWILQQKIKQEQERPIYYYKREWIDGKPEYVPISVVDIMDSRFKT